MSKQRGIRYWTRSIFNVSRWVGWHNIKQNASNIQSLYNTLFKTNPVSLYRETFEQAVERMGLVEDDIDRVKKNYFRYSCLFLVLFILGLLYHAYLIYHEYWAASIVMCSIDFMLFAFWFREHFWYTQMKVRRLGLTVKEWIAQCFHFNG